MDSSDQRTDQPVADECTGLSVQVFESDGK